MSTASSEVSTKSEIFLGRQPILALDKSTVAYELLFRSEDSLLEANVADDLLSTSTVIVNMLSQFGLDNVLGNCDAFLNVSASLLMSETIELLPPERIIFEILEDVPISSQLVERCIELKDRGFRLAIDDFVYRSEYDPILPLIDYLKVDLEITAVESLPKVIAEIRKHSNATLLAEKVEEESQYIACKDLGFSLFQGYFFAHPVVITGKKPQPNQISLMRIMGMLIGDANVSELEVPFKESPTLTISLLRLVNSVAVSGGRRQEISTLRQAIVILGQKQLLRWVQLLLYVSPEGNIANSLMQQVSNRARLMELIANRLDSYKATGDQAFMVGMLSLVHAVLKTPQEEVLAQIAIPETLKLAITKREGLLGQLLNLTEMIEKYEFEEAGAAIHELGMSVSDFTSIQLQAMQWANELNKQAQD